MTAAFATLIFLIALWAAAVAIAQMLHDRGDRIAAALRGQSLAARPALRTAPVRFSPRYVARQPRRVRATPPLRAAA